MPLYLTLFSRDPNTIFRGNSLTSKCIDETMKLAGMHYLHVTLKPTIEEVRGRCWRARESRGKGRRHRARSPGPRLSPELWASQGTRTACPQAVHVSFSPASQGDLLSSPESSLFSQIRKILKQVHHSAKTE